MPRGTLLSWACIVGLLISAVVGAPSRANAQREPNTTLTLPLTPRGFGYAVEPAFGADLRFVDPVAIRTPPGETNRLFVVEQRGVISVITNLAAPNRSVFMAIEPNVAGGQPFDERGLLGLAFHPGFATNGQFFIYYSTLTNGVLNQRLSRFQVTEWNPNQGDPFSETILISQRDDAGNHNGGDIHFGPDGYLYVSVGDEGGANDEHDNSRFIDKDFHAGILRIDVDLRPDSLPPNPHPAVFPGAYAIPPDNPWIGATEFNGRAVDPVAVRTEFYAVGLRNPWRMSFDPASGQLWAGDVGQTLLEEINVIQRGGNYGWAFFEGTQPGPRRNQMPAGFQQIPPVVQYGHGSGPMQGNSVTGGVVYRGQRLPELHGAYIFADYLSGNIWAIRWDGQSTPPMQRLTSRASIAGFGYDPRNGDILMANQGSDTIERLTYNSTPVGDPLPETLAETGAFADLETLQPNAGIVPYEINVPFWSDGASKSRWFSIPDPQQTIGFRADEPWLFPTGAVWIKHFEIQLTNGVPESTRRLETRFLVRNTTGVYGVTYRWTDPPTNAVLVPEEGLSEELVIQDGGIQRTQVWRYPSRSECLQCHTPAAGWVLGFHTSQLNRTIETPDGPTNQLSWLASAGYFSEPIPDPLPLRALAPADDQTFSREWRVRSWLDANCSQCHRPGGAALGAWDARASVPLSVANIVNGPLYNPQDPADRLVIPGSVEHSMIHSRITRTGPGRMPPVGSHVIDEASAALLRQWITNDLPSRLSFAQWQTEHFGSPDDRLAAPFADPDGDQARNDLEFLSYTDPTDPSDFWALAIDREADSILLRYDRVRNRDVQLQWMDPTADNGDWKPVLHPANRFLIPPETVPVEISQPIGDGSRFYRLRIAEP